MVEKDLYSVLGVAPDAPQSRIREAYIRISRVVHPDRFDQHKQPVEWRQANEMLKEANRAYEVLKDPEKRARYDATRATPQPPPSKQTQSSPPRSASAPKQESKSTAEPSGPTHGSAHFSQLPEQVQERLLERQANKISEQCHVQTEGVFWKYLWAAVFCGWFWLLFTFASDNPWSESSLLWFSLITVAVSVFIGRQAHWIWRWHKSKLKCRFYATPLYFVQTHLDEVKWWPLLKLQDLKVTHNYRNGIHQDTDIRLVFPEGTKAISVSSKQSAENLLDGLRKLDQKMREAAAQERWDYFAVNDDFRSVASHPAERGWLTKSRSVAYGATLAIGLVLMLSAYNMNADNSSVTGIPPQTNYSSPSYSGSPAQPPAPAFNEPAQPLPYNGAVQRYHSGEGLAPLEIRTRGYDRHYFVKVTDYYTDQPIATVFIHGGSSAEISVPLGTFKLKYATGQEWYGEDFLFGPETSYSEADQAFHFTDEGYQYSGYTVELFLQADGNLRTDRITPDQF